MISEAFAAGDSIIHNLDPRTRIIFATVYCFVVATSGHFPVLLTALAVSMTLVLITGIRLKEIGRRMVMVNGLILLLWAVVPLTYGGEALFEIGWLDVSRQGVSLSARITLKSNAILLAFISLIATMTFATLGYALKELMVPPKIIQLLLMNYRYIFVIEQEYQRLIRAAKIRGFQPKTSLHTYRTYAYVIGMLLVRTATRAERVHQAMLCRGFKGIFYSLQEFKWDRKAWIFSMLMTIIIIGLILMEWTRVGW
ncbi:MAG: cobalt ECF transporter T component CbiQ [Desulfobacterales bacterium]|nr:MAG: cobalt ECF transporter T component CbiQ [Desulfobacterales bacterium]